MREYFAVAPNFVACIFLCSSGVRVHDSQAYRKMDVTMELISHILELRESSCHSKLVSTFLMHAVVCAVLESISGLEPSSIISEPRCLKLVTVSSFSRFTLISVDAAGVVCRRFCGPCYDEIRDERGLILLEFATFNDLVLSSTFGHYKASRRWTWHSPNGQHHNQTDYI